MLIPRIVASEPLNGWALSQRLKQISSEVLGVSDGSLYPALHKLERRGWITAQWKSSGNNRRAKFNSVTRLDSISLDPSGIGTGSAPSGKETRCDRGDR